MTGETSTSWSSGGAMGPHGDDAEKRQCTARAKSTGERCRRSPMRGANVCMVHGGKARQVKAAAARRLAAAKVEADVRDAIAFESREGVTDPLAALSQLADEALATKEALAARVNALKTIRYSAHGSGTEQLRAEVALYERSMDRAAKFLDLLAKSGFEERRVALAEEQGALMASAIRAILDRMLSVALAQASDPDALRIAWRGAVGSVVPEELRRVTATVESEVVR